MHVISRLIPGGVERRTLELIRFTHGEGIEHHVLVSSGQRGTLDDDYRAAGVRLHYLPVQSVFFVFRFVILLRRLGISVLHSNIMYTSGLLLFGAWIARVPRRIAHFQSDGQKVGISWLKLARHRVLREMIGLFATKIVGLTPDNLTLAWNPNWRDDSRCEVVVNGVQTSEFAVGERSAMLGMPEAVPIVVHVGRGDLPTKNREKAARVISALTTRLPDCQLVFVGRDGRDAEEAETHRKGILAELSPGVDSSRVRFVGEVDNVSDYLAAADLFLFTSTLEGLPGVVIEALASGLPVVSSDLPGVRYIVESVPGLPIRLLDPDQGDESWATAIVELLDESAEGSRAARAEQIVGTPFDIQESARGYVNLWTAPGQAPSDGFQS
ncbi:glycosyltransferase [Microbacterium suwonense]|uniref:Glycosyltransferase subfamily 4-like N-terminal domain-containing protein n=1 Tax=Microbacterium suwonense TaxID=683047 RepID=A0ABM8FU67_9MICO|nr:glycosyltransferase [Microbacterium suwonense]BDZ39223.1 hypothetical protein GCM10025863_18370 [Microbacterium suwonense]